MNRVNRMNRTKWHTHDLTLAQFWHPPTPPAVNRRKWQRDTVDGFERRASWGGMAKADTLALPQRGWPDGVDAALRLMQEPELHEVGASGLTAAAGSATSSGWPTG